ncbi:MAG TPA: hypothetical protein VGO11_16010 [Chthoniobacteraceae bacterium]|jgi:hypothetical protein|nr:hypothetical protein [Chthoniobacteraceae bacterium]
MPDEQTAEQFFGEDETDRFVKAARQRLKEMDSWTPEQQFQSLVRAGIYTPKGELRVEYGGTGRDENTDEGYCTFPMT